MPFHCVIGKVAHANELLRMSTLLHNNLDVVLRPLLNQTDSLQNVSYVINSAFLNTERRRSLIEIQDSLGCPLT